MRTRHRRQVEANVYRYGLLSVLGVALSQWLLDFAFTVRS